MTKKLYNVSHASYFGDGLLRIAYLI